MELQEKGWNRWTDEGGASLALYFHGRWVPVGIRNSNLQWKSQHKDISLAPTFPALFQCSCSWSGKTRAAGVQLQWIPSNVALVSLVEVAQLKAWSDFRHEYLIKFKSFTLQCISVLENHCPSTILHGKANSGSAVAKATCFRVQNKAGCNENRNDLDQVRHGLKRRIWDREQACQSSLNNMRWTKWESGLTWHRLT